MDISAFEHPHTAERIAKSIYSVICDWELNGKVQCLTVDDGPNIIKAAKILTGEIKSDKFVVKTDYLIPFFLKCTAHTMQRIIRFGIDNGTIEIDKKIIPIQLLVLKMR